MSVCILLLSLAGLVTAIAGIFHQHHIGNRDAEIWAMNTAVWCLVSVLGAIVNILQKRATR